MTDKKIKTKKAENRAAAPVLKRIFLSVFFLSAVMAQGTASAQPELKLPALKRVTLANGLKVILIEQHEVPIVNFRITVRAGSILDPPGKEGLANLTAELLRRGTTTRSADRIAAEIDFIGGLIDFEAEHDFAAGEGEFLTKDVEAGFDILIDLLRNPAFPIAEMSKLIKQEIDEVRQSKDEAENAISEYFNTFLFGTHLYARPPGGDERSLAAVRRPDIVAFYNSHYGPKGTTIVVAGDFESSRIERMISDKLSSWKGGRTQTAQQLPQPPIVKGKKLLLVDKPDSTQTYFHIGNVGVARTNPDRVGIELVNTVFGGRFTSILNDALRVSSGLTYGASSDFEMNGVAGPFTISSFTQNATTVQALDMALDVLKKLHTQGLTQEQLNSARNYLKGQFPPQIETGRQLSQLVAELDFYGLDEEEVNSFFSRLDRLTVEDANRVIRTYYPLDDIVFVLIGKATEIREKVKKYAPRIDEVPISRPGFGTTPAAHTRRPSRSGHGVSPSR